MGRKYAIRNQEGLHFVTFTIVYWLELSTNEMLDQRLDYTHNNPVEAGLVEEAHYWLHSSARDYAEAGKGKIELLFV